MRAQCFLLVIPNRYEKKQPREKCDDDDADCRSGQQFEMKMFWAEKPRDASSENPFLYDRGWVGRVGPIHYKFHKAGILP